MPRHNETAKVERDRQHDSNHEFDRRRLNLHTCRINAPKVINSLCRRNFDGLQPGEAGSRGERTAIEFSHGGRPVTDFIHIFRTVGFVGKEAGIAVEVTVPRHR
jgi:hypothetical protein